MNLDIYTSKIEWNHIINHHKALNETLQRDVGLKVAAIDYLEKYNGTYGHQEGDGAILLTGLSLLKSTRKSDIVCRHGGDEIVVIMPHTDHLTTGNDAERVLQAVDKSLINSAKLGIFLSSIFSAVAGLALLMLSPVRGRTPEADYE